MGASVYLVAYVDGNWDGWGPLDPMMDYGNPPAPVEEIEDNLRNAIPFMKDATDGKFIFGAHTSTYCRDLFYREPVVGLYREVVAGGGEICLHPHEEAIKVAPLVDSPGHMTAVIGQKRDELRAAGIQPTCFRMGLGAFNDQIPSLLENAGIHIDLSAAPGLDRWYWRADWRNTSYSAYYLCPVHYNDTECLHARTDVLEIPWGNDGLGGSFSENFLYNEAASLATNQRVWDAILARADKSGTAQFVYFLLHLSTMSHINARKKAAKFLRYVRSHDGELVTCTEARLTFDELGG